MKHTLLISAFFCNFFSIALCMEEGLQEPAAKKQKITGSNFALPTLKNLCLNQIFAHLQHLSLENFITELDQNLMHTPQEIQKPLLVNNLILKLQEECRKTYQNGKAAEFLTQMDNLKNTELDTTITKFIRNKEIFSEISSVINCFETSLKEHISRIEKKPTSISPHRNSASLQNYLILKKLKEYDKACKDEKNAKFFNQLLSSKNEPTTHLCKNTCETNKQIFSKISWEIDPFVKLESPNQTFTVNLPTLPCYQAYSSELLDHNFCYVPKHKLLLCYLKSNFILGNGSYGAYEFIAIHVPSNQQIFKERGNVWNNAQSINKINVLDDYIFLQTGTHTIQKYIIIPGDIPKILFHSHSSRPSYLKDIKDTKFLYNGIVMLTPKRAEMTTSNKDGLSTTPKNELILYKNKLPNDLNIRHSKARHTFKSEPNILYNGPTYTITYLMSNPSKNLIVACNVIRDENSNHIKIQIQKLQVLKTKFKVLKELTYESSLTLHNPENPSKEDLNSIKKELDKYLSENFSEDNPLLWDQEYHNPKILNYSPTEYCISIPNIIKTILTNPQATFFGELTDILQKNLPKQSSEFLPTGKEGKMEMEQE